ncbi:hypothetical protein Dimus_024234, partial [Dionaea muscipula]
FLLLQVRHKFSLSLLYYIGYEMKDNYETTWADQWDPSPALGSSPPRSGPRGGGTGHGAAAQYGKKVEKGLLKTKDVAVVGMKRVKNGASVGFSWIKDKYHKTTHKH